jgi:gamma-glutamyl-gamma-aminobutyrate hydrolase PuuD
MKYDLQSKLDSIYSLSKEGKCRPVIGITANFNDGDTTLNKPYYAQVVAAGGVPMLIPPVADHDVLLNTLDHIDGLLLSGGADINPLWAGEEPSPNLHHINAERDLPELLLTLLAYNRQIPILGICRGIQTLAVALGGEVMQDIGARSEERLRVGERNSGMRGARSVTVGCQFQEDFSQRFVITNISWENDIGETVGHHTGHIGDNLSHHRSYPHRKSFGQDVV